jgi:hypothetical protein
LSTYLLFHKLKERLISCSTLNLTKKNSLIFILIFTTIVVFDSSIVKFSSYSGVEFPIQLNFAIFVVFSIIFVTASIILINSVRKFISGYAFKPAQQTLALRYFHAIITATLILSAAIILMIVLQMILLNNYSVILLSIQTYLSRLSPLIFLSFLIFLFVRWLASSKRNYVIMLYVISFSLVSVNLVVSLIYLQSLFFSTSSLPYVKPYPIYSYVIMLPGFAFTESLSALFDVLSLSSFLLMWMATAILLSQYRYRMGRIKYFLLMSIPLIYYIFPFQNYFGDVLFPLFLTSPVAFSTIYVLIFSATKQVGALLFSLSFWTASTLVHDDRVRKSLLISSMGIAILFGSIELTPLQYLVFPPYGLITQAFIPLGAYLLFVGIFSSAKYISQDAKLRKEFYKSAASQLTLLKSIGVLEMEKEFEKKVAFVQEHSRLAEQMHEPHLEEEIGEENVKDILRDVLNELYSKKTKEEAEK